MATYSFSLFLKIFCGSFCRSMPKSINRLSVAAVRNTNDSGVFADGNGLYLQVRNDGKNIRKSWLFRYMRAGRSRSMGLGSLKKVTLADARIAANDANKLLHQDIDPLANKRIKTNASTIPNFKEASKQYIDTHKASWKNEKHIAQWTNTLRDYANPTIGTTTVDEIERTHLVEILLPIWLQKPETARRVRGRIERILDWSQAEGYRDGDNPARFRGNLEYSLPAQSSRSWVDPGRRLSAFPRNYFKLLQSRHLL